MGKNKNLLSRIKVYFLEECLTLLTFAVLMYSPAILGLILPLVTCIKVKGFIIVWLLYYLWIYYDSTTLKTKGRKIHQLKFWFSFQFFRDFFSLRLIKTTDLPPKCNYIFAIYPHGALPYGVICNFITDTGKFSELFPDIDVRPVTLEPIFWIPIFREYFMAAGGCTSDENNLKYLLNSKPSKAIAILPGGCKDMSLSRPGGEYRIYSHRKGFVRIALQTGAPLVPVFTFGEQNTQEVIEINNRIMHYFNTIFHKFTRIRICLINGRGILQNKFGLLPRRCRLTTVVGKPIQTPKVENPSDELIDKYHKEFFEALKDLFENNKHMYDEAGSSAELIMV